MDKAAVKRETALLASDRSPSARAAIGSLGRLGPPRVAGELMLAGLILALVVAG